MPKHGKVRLKPDAPYVFWFFVLAGVMVIAAGCSKSAGPATTTTAPVTAAKSAQSAGKIVGKAPPPNAGSFVVVTLEPRTPRTFPEQTETPVMDQVGQTFGPELLLVRTGEPVQFRNSDDTLHNVHVNNEDTREPAFNVAIPTGESYTYTFTRDGFYHVACDIHPAMSASIFASTTPFTTLADRNGGFAFDDVPSGPWRVIAYAGGKQLERDIEIHAGTIDVTLQ